MAGWGFDRGGTGFLPHVGLASVIMLLALVLLMGGASAADDLPWTDDFDDGDMDGWLTATSRNGVVKVDQTQSKSSPYALHIKSPQDADKALAYPNITYNHSLGVLIQFDFRIAPNYHWVWVWDTWQSHVVADTNSLVARDHRGVNNHIMSISTNKWYHLKIHYNASSHMSTIWVDGVEKLTFREIRAGSFDHLRVGEVFTSENHGEAWWDNFNVSYHNAPFDPIPLSPIDNESFDGTPDMEWKFVDASTSDFQTAYHVQVANDTEFTDPIYDSGVVEDLASLHDTPRLPFGTWFWRVRARDNESMWSGWSDPAEFTVNNTNKAPVWGEIGNLTAVEDVPITYDFTSFIEDVDDVVGNLSLTCVAPFVTNISGLNITFLFHEGVTQASVTIQVKDLWRSAVIDVNFTITPVNDGPVAFVPIDHTAVEDIPYTFDLSPFVQDVDNTLSELSVEIDDTFATLEGLKVTFTFPDGVLAHEVWFNVTDGEIGAPVHMSFTITPVNDPPVILDLGTFVAIEDVDSVFDLAPYLSDIDNPVGELSVIVRSYNCTADGMDLHFLYTRGGLVENVRVQVTDGHSMVEDILEVQVEERNDPPVIRPMIPKQFIEDEEGWVDLTAYIADEDTELGEITVTCSHPAVVAVDDLNLTFMFTSWQPEHDVFLNVSDGYQVVEGHFLAQVLAVNDAPVILGIGEADPPVTIEIDEGSAEEYQVRVVDEDDTNFKYLLSTQWAGATLGPNGMLLLDALQGDVGEYTATISVKDPAGASDELTFTIVILNVNDPRTPPVIMKPANHTIVERGTNVTFAVSVSDPDEMYGQVLTVTWTSNISGVIAARSTEEGLEFTRNDLVAGVHRITVQVSDGEHLEERWFVLEVIEPYVPPPPVEDPTFYETTSGLGLILLMVLAVIIVALLLVIRSRKGGEEAEVETPVEPVVTAEVEEPRDLAALGAEIGAMADQLEATRAAEALPMYGPEPPPTTPAALDLEDVAAPTAEELAEREHTIQVREVMKVLTQLPRGLPTTLWGKDMSLLAKEIVDGPRRTGPDGFEYVEVEGKLYRADHTNVGTFLSEWKEEKKAPPRPTTDPGERQSKLDKLEERLLDGDISEKTYERLRKKFEGG